MIKCFHLTIPAPHGGPPIFDELTLEISPRTWAEISGPTSSGKSLLFNLLALRSLSARGKLIVGGRNLERLKGKGYATLRQSIGSCSQTPELLLDRTTLENLIVPLVVRKNPKDAAHKALVLLEAVGREALRDVPVRILSREDQLLIAVLRAIIGQPPMILIDGCIETFPPRLRETLVKLLEEAREKGSTVIIFSRQPTPERPDDAIVWTIARGTLEETPVAKISTSPPAPAQASKQKQQPAEVTP